ncbi:hypothetical protein CC99x_005600 [Candidatus Berkiella cookevillensis]|uniref:Lipoprotein n=1 Tax=Candidatus Berkiella cookevillensis TaxID=437022 RepID=A0A0Q9YT77_9GAMM|nr:hypothetical protein [Candidatus Berkiella cookevillensis]MCS5708377.1 hypothetical protein [Candidatus Berkiella cookevillensis]
MKRTSIKIGLTLAATAAALFATGCTTLCGESQEALVKCSNVNACKGSSECATPSNSCKGRNSCKSSGWVYMTKSECLANGGSVRD